MHCYPSQHEFEGQTIYDAECDIVALRGLASMARVVVTNYHAYYWSGHHFGPREILWGDEIQHIPASELKTVRVPRYAIPGNVLAYLMGLQDVENINKKSLEKASAALNEVREQIADKIFEMGDENNYSNALSSYEELYSNMSFTLNTGHLDCQPIYLNNYGAELFLQQVPIAIGMSGTLLDGKQIGVRNHDVHKFAPTLPSPEIATWKSRAKSTPERFDNVVSAVDGNQGDRGVVFFASKRETEEFAARNPNSRWIMQRSPGAREEVEKLANSKDGVLLTYGGHEGLDLVDDLARFGVLAKMPFLNLGDPHVKSNFVTKGWGWYNQECGLKIRQAAGRLIRHKDDYGMFYLADKGSPRFPHEGVWANDTMGVLSPQEWVRL